jgi:hypothetical protein
MAENAITHAYSEAAAAELSCDESTFRVEAKGKFSFKNE